MKLLKFILLLFRRGSLQHEPIDFAAQRKKILQGLPEGIENRISRIPKNKILYTLKSNLSYLRRAPVMNTMLFISIPERLVYIRIFKAASTSILKEFLPRIDSSLAGINLTDDQIDAISNRYVKGHLTATEQQYQKFAVVRDPFQRITSVYMDLFDPIADYFSYDSYWFGILKRGMSFPEFINVISKIPEWLKGPHFASQHYILSKATELSDLKCFRLEKDMVSLERFLSPYKITMHVHNKQKSSYNYKALYNEVTLKQVYSMYEKDIHTFDYQQEYQDLKNFLHLRNSEGHNSGL